MKNTHVQGLAVEMRKKGFSYREISERLHLSKSTCSLWLRNVTMGGKARRRITSLSEIAKMKARSTIIQKKIKRDSIIQEKILQDFVHLRLTLSVRKLLCSFLYWSEGEKSGSRISFTNSDPSMILCFMKLLRTSFKIKEKKFGAILHLHSYHNLFRQKKFWSRITRIPISRISVYNKANSGKNIHEGYQGCISIRYHDVALYREVEGYVKNFLEKYGGVV